MKEGSREQFEQFLNLKPSDIYIGAAKYDPAICAFIQYLEKHFGTTLTGKEPKGALKGFHLISKWQWTQIKKAMGVD